MKDVQGVLIMIDEKKLIEELEDMIGMLPIYYIGKKDEENAYLDAINRTLSAVKRQSKIREWIPVEEKMPKNLENILVSCDNGEVDYGFYSDDHFVLDYIDDEAYPVIAWMPLPEPYKENEKNNK